MILIYVFSMLVKCVIVYFYMFKLFTCHCKSTLLADFMHSHSFIYYFYKAFSRCSKPEKTNSLINDYIKEVFVNDRHLYFRISVGKDILIYKNSTYFISIKVMYTFKRNYQILRESTTSSYLIDVFGSTGTKAI
jgi:hypothetical protein